MSPAPPLTPKEFHYMNDPSAKELIESIWKEIEQKINCNKSLLIEVEKGTLLNKNFIKKADQVGNYIHIETFDNDLYRIWDEDEKIWNQLKS